MTPKNLFKPSDKCWKNLHLKVKQIQKITKGKGAELCFLDDGIGKNKELWDVLIDRWTYFAEAAIAGNHSTNGATIVAGKKFGIFPEITKLISKQVLDPEYGTGGSREIVSAIKKAKEMGIKTINLSLGSNAPDPKIKAALQSYCDNGVNIATIASGNDGPGSNTTDYPANYARTIKGVISVGATQISRNGIISIATFSSRGKVTISAPGQGLKSMDLDNNIDFVSGTSFSAPIVGAFIAVARTLINRDLTQDEVLAIFEETSDEIDTKANTGVGEISGIDFLKRVQDLPYKPIAIESEFKKSWLCKLLKC